MESINQPVSGKKMGHVRRQSYGKIMPISSILNNLIGSNTNHMSETSGATEVSPLTHSFETLTKNNRVNERSDGDHLTSVTDSTLSFIHHEKVNDQINQSKLGAIEPLASELDVKETFLKCTNYHHRDSITEEEEVTPMNAKLDPEDDIDRVLIDDVNAPCSICSNNATVKHSLLNILCKKLCDDSCNTSTKTCQSNEDIVTEESDPSTERDSEPVDISDRKDQIANALLQRSNSSRQEFLASMLESGPNDDDIEDHRIDGDEAHIAPLTIENLKQFNDDYFREKLAIAEALANTSMMTSSGAKSRLAARKIEMSLNTPDFVYDPANAEYIPPKELLMYLMR